MAESYRPWVHSSGIGMLPPMDGERASYDTALQAMDAVKEIRSLPRSTPANSPRELEDKYQEIVPRQLQRAVGDDEYDQSVRHNALINRLQALENEDPAGYRAFYRENPRWALQPGILQRTDRPPRRYRNVNWLTYPGHPVAEGLRYWDATTSGVVNAARMAAGNEEAANDFAKNANTLLLGVPGFLKDGTFSKEADRYNDIVGSAQFDSGPYMQNPESIRYVADMAALGDADDRWGMRGTSTLLGELGAPRGTALDVAGLLLDNFIDPDGGAIRALRAVRGGSPVLAAIDLSKDNALGAILYGASRATGSGPWSVEE